MNAQVLPREVGRDRTRGTERHAHPTLFLGNCPSAWECPVRGQSRMCALVRDAAGLELWLRRTRITGIAEWNGTHSIPVVGDKLIIRCD